MPGKPVVKGAQPIQFVEETEFGIVEETPSWEMLGYITSHEAEQTSESETFPFLPEPDMDNKLEQKKNVKVSESWDVDTSLHPVTFDHLQYVTGEDGGTASEIPSLQVGEVDEENEKYRHIMGLVPDGWELTVSEDSISEVGISWMGADGEDWSDGTLPGTPSSVPTDDPLIYSDLGNIEYGGEPLHAVEELSVSIDNDIEVTKDPDQDFDSNIYSLDVTNRDIEVEIGLTYESMDLAQEVRAYEAKDFTFDLGPYSFTITGVQFPSFPYEMSPEDLIGDSISSDPADGITWSS